MIMQIADKRDGNRQWQYMYNGNSKKSNNESNEVLIKNQL